MLEKWIVKPHHLSGWRITPPGNTGIPLSPQYRGAFEAGENPPRRIQLGTDLPADFQGAEPRGGGSARFRAPSRPLGRRREFGVSLEVDPEVWTPHANRKGWQVFSAGAILLGIWTSLPATWLAAGSDGIPLPPPWRELWTFGTDHVWSFRLSRSESGKASPGMESFIEHCLSTPPSIPALRKADSVFFSSSE